MIFSFKYKLLLIYELSNKNNLKNINNQNFALIMRGYDKDFYGIHMRGISPAGIQYWDSEHPIQITISNVNLNISDNAHSGI